jgi:hypothetical protein
MTRSILCSVPSLLSFFEASFSRIWQYVFWRSIRHPPITYLSSSSVPNQEEHIGRIVNNRGLRTFLIVGHTANLRKIWHHGGERRVFSTVKRTLTPESNALGLNILEACECLPWWWRNGVVTGTVIVCPTATRVQNEAQLVTALLGDAGPVEEDVDYPIFYSPQNRLDIPN